MAPERLDGGPATEKSDLWSLGLTLATAALGENPISLASNEFAQLSLAIRAQRTIKRETELSPELIDFLCRCLSPDPARRPAIRELMHHSFLKQRRDWQAKCPEVARAMRARKRRQREEARTLSTESVLQALCQARAEDNLGGAPLDPATAADLAYELGVTPTSLVRAVIQRTRRLSSSCGCGGESDDSDEICICNGEGCTEGGSGRYGGGYREGCTEGAGGDEGRTSAKCSGQCCGDGSEPGLSPMCSPPQGLEGLDGAREAGCVAPVATVVGCSPASSVGVTWTPRTPRAETPWTPSRRSREMTSTVKLTPHKRRHELRRRSSKIRAGASSSSPRRTARKQRRERLRAEREEDGRREPGEPSREGSVERERRRRSGKLSQRGEDAAAPEEACVSRGMPPEGSDVFKSTRGLYQLADLMKSEIKVKDRIHRFRVYKGCFSGREAVQWMIDGAHASSLNEALTLGNEMMNWGVFAHIMNSHVFEDSSVYYQFTDGKPPPPPASGGRRLGQVARVMLKKIVEGVVGSKSGDEFEASLQEIVSKASFSASSDPGTVGSRQNSGSRSSFRQRHDKNRTAEATPVPTASVEETEGTSVASGASSNIASQNPPVQQRHRPPRAPSASLDRKSSRPRRQDVGARGSVASVGRRTAGGGGSGSGSGGGGVGGVRSGGVGERRAGNGSGGGVGGGSGGSGGGLGRVGASSGPAAAVTAAAAAAAAARGAATGPSATQLRRFSSSISTATVPETPY